MATIETYRVDERTLGLRIELGEVAKGGYEPYVRQPGDILYNDDTTVFRDGAYYGELGGPGLAYVNRADGYVADPAEALLNAQGGAADDPARWTITVDGRAVDVTGVWRKAKVLESAETGSYVFDFKTQHTVHLALDAPIPDGARVAVDAPGATLPVPAATIDDGTRSEAVHVSQIGFDPGDPRKAGYLSTWLGTDGDGDDASVPYAEGIAFWVVDEATGARVFEGETILQTPKEEATGIGRNFAKADTYELDFSAVDAPGRYHLVVDGVGRSFSFEIGEKVWEDAFVTSARGFYHQRSGIEIEAPYADWENSRSLHPDDGLVVAYQSTAKISDTDMGYKYGAAPDAFAALVAGRTDEVIEEAWGGWHDAGDWDRRTQHLEEGTYRLLELYEHNPAYFGAVDLNLPESGDAVPDLVDEALWNLDLFQRLQKDDGGVPGGIEQAAHPEKAETSSTNTLETFVYAPDQWSSWAFAASAAKAATVLDGIDAVRAQGYLQDAIRAYEWAETNPDGSSADKKVVDASNLAALELYRATGDAAWHDRFLATSSYTRPNDALTYGDQQFDAAYLYASIDDLPVDADAQASARAGFLEQAAFRFLIEGPFGEVSNPFAAEAYGSTGPQAEDTADFLARAHALTGDGRYVEAMIGDTGFGLGANPDNLVYTTGLGERNVGPEILHVDADVTGRAAPPGLTVYGTYDPTSAGGVRFWHDLIRDAVRPSNPIDTPVYETHQGFFLAVESTEFTTQDSTGSSAYAWGYLAQLDETGGPAPIRGTPGADKLRGTAQADVIEGLGGSDSLIGRGGDDALSGGGGRDWLWGNDGADALRGGGGDDILVGGRGADVLEGGAGYDRATYIPSAEGVTVTLGGTGRGGDAEGDRLSGIEQVVGSRFADTLTGDGADNRLNGSDGADRLDGAGGADTLRGGAGRDSFVFREGSGRDRVTDFDAARDRLVFEGLGEADLSLREAGARTIIEWGAGDRLDILSTTGLTLDDEAIVFA